MKTYYLSLKKCLTSSVAALFLVALPSQASIQSHILKDIQTLKGKSFQHLIQKWEKRYQSKAVTHLIQIAKDQKNKDQARYIAMMSAVKIGGEATIPQIEKLVSDHSWMVRMGVLKAIRATSKVSHQKVLVRLLSDPAIVVRNEAILTMSHLNFPNRAKHLMKSLNAPMNQYPKVPLWLIERMLSEIAKEKQIQDVSELRKFIKETSHPKLIKRGIQTLELVKKN